MTEHCESCGAKIVEYKHGLNKLLASALLKVAALSKSRPVHLKEAHLTHSERDNFQKLRYFGLVAKSFSDDGLRIQGCWQLTPKGRLFVEGIGYCYPTVWTYRGDPVRFEGDPIEIVDLIDTSSTSYQEIKLAQDYAAEAMPHV